MFIAMYNYIVYSYIGYVFCLLNLYSNLGLRFLYTLMFSGFCILTSGFGTYSIQCVSKKR